MNNAPKHVWRLALPALLIALPAYAQVPVDADGQLIGEYEPSAGYATGEEDIPLLPPGELEDLVGPIALYPDDLLAIVLPASTYPLQVVQAQRFLEALEDDPSLEPDPDWDDSIVALINYPEVVDLLNEDLDWTWRLGEAVVAQQADVVSAVETFRDRAYAAGNLKSDDYQEVTRDDGIIEITPVNDDIIYVPYYEPARVIVHQPRPVYYYYPRPCPVYYYPYPSGYAFSRGYFWGVTTAFTIGWTTDRLRVYHHSYHGHPYYGRRYWDRWWYRRPSIGIHNRVYIDNSVHISVNRYTRGDYWRPSRHTRLRYTDQRITRSGYYPGGRDRRSSVTTTRRSPYAASNRSTSVKDRRNVYTSGYRQSGQSGQYRRNAGQTDSRTVNRSQATTRRNGNERRDGAAPSWQQRVIAREGASERQRQRYTTTDRSQGEATRYRNSTRQSGNYQRREPTNRSQAKESRNYSTSNRQSESRGRSSGSSNTQRAQKSTGERRQPIRESGRRRDR